MRNTLVCVTGFVIMLGLCLILISPAMKVLNTMNHDLRTNRVVSEVERCFEKQNCFHEWDAE